MVIVTSESHATIYSVLHGIPFVPVASTTSCGNAEGIHLCAE